MKRRLKLTMIYKEDEPKPNTWGSDDIIYEVTLFYDEKVDIYKVIIDKVGTFGDRTLEKAFKVDMFEEGIDFIKEISQMDYKTFKEKLLGE